ncbi:hypothetical protein LJR066_004019 [Acidovorax sp. LjRoot66]
MAIDDCIAPALQRPGPFVTLCDHIAHHWDRGRDLGGGVPW